MDDDDLALIEALEAAQANIVVDDEVPPETAMQQYQEMGFPYISNFLAKAFLCLGVKDLTSISLNAA